jgi:glucosamine 6-phosphate synthetase-like amidotransferase/phosphosugar isomerase protein
MCGIFGSFVSNKKQTLSPSLMQKLAASQLERGSHAWGIAWIDGTGRIRSFKSIGPITQGLDFIGHIAQDARAMIGHTRWATHGPATELACAHPFTCDGGYLVHNGMVMNSEELSETWGVYPTSECDSEVLARCIECYKDRSQGARLVINDTPRQSPLAIAALWGGENPELLIARRGNPIFIASIKSTAKQAMQTAFASTCSVFEKHNGATYALLSDNRIILRKLYSKGKPELTLLEVPPPQLKQNLVLGSNYFQSDWDTKEWDTK